MKIKVFNIRLTKEHLEVDEKKINDFLEDVEVLDSTMTLVTGKINFWSLIFQYKERTKTSKSKLSEADLTANEIAIVERLKHWRWEQSQKEETAVFMILPNATLYSLARNRPTDLENLLDIYGMGETKVEKYGNDLIALLNATE
ncbi:hypothetical protein GO491_05805 [Flavobacteriaceae bacterium Ap0902]|nr:hypothetical protein [Flavobacteriaceae bacterium Ap0902]